MISFSAEQNSTMPAHLSIIQHLLFHLLKLCGKKKKIALAHSQGVERRGGGAKEVRLEGPDIHFSFSLHREDHVIRTAVTKLGGGRPMLLDVTSIALAHYLEQSLILPRKTGVEKREIDNIVCTIMHRQRIEI